GRLPADDRACARPTRHPRLRRAAVARHGRARSRAARASRAPGCPRYPTRRLGATRAEERRRDPVGMGGPRPEDLARALTLSDQAVEDALAGASEQFGDLRAHRLPRCRRAAAVERPAGGVIRTVTCSQERLAKTRARDLPRDAALASGVGTIRADAAACCPPSPVGVPESRAVIPPHRSSA